MEHGSECKCPTCINKRIQDSGFMLAELYQTKTTTIRAITKEYDGTSWSIYYEVIPNNPNHQGSGGWMPLEVWNKSVNKWLNELG